jgi:cyclopropane fatty-acyl-phospholipid synthase-like methyltransferase
MENDIPDNWYESFFSGINCEMWEKAATQEWTDAEVSFIKDILNVEPGSSILDIPCGTGRHSIGLAKQEFHVTSIDISTEFLNGLKKKVDDQQLTIEIIQGNILSLELKGSFDGAFCLGNSFGYFNFPGMETFVAKVSASLKQDARWIINTGLMAESFLAKFIKEKKYELEGLTMQIINDYDEWNSCLLTTLSYTKNNTQEIYRFKHHVYTVAELIRLLKKYDLQTIALYSSTDKAAFKLGDAQLYLVAQKEK